MDFDSHGGRRSEDRYLGYDEDRRGIREVGHAGLGFDAPGELGRRGRDPTPRSKGDDFVTQRKHGADGARAVPEPGAGLGQLASVFEVVARLDATGELRRLSREVLEERKNLEQHLARRREVELKLQESRGQVEGLREERRRVETESSAAQRHAAHLQDELGFVEREVKDAEEDLNSLRESADLSRAQRHGPAPYSSPEEERRDVLSKVRAEKELLQRDQRSIEELRVKLEQVFKEKLDAEFMALNLELERERRLRAKMELDHGRELEQEIENVRMLIADNRKKSEQEETALVVQISEESDNLKKLLLDEHANRDESEKSMVKLLDEMYTKLHREVDEERNDRENTQERFIRMLEGLA